MRKILKVARREYLETVKTKTFILGVLMAPAIIGGIIFFTSRMSRDKKGPRPPIRVGVTDSSGLLLAEARASFDRHNGSHPDSQILLNELAAQDEPNSVEQKAKEELRRGRLDVYVVLDADVLDGSGKIRLYTYKTKAANIDALWTVESLFNRAVVNRRCQIQDIDPKVLEELRDVPIERLEIGSADGKERVQGRDSRILGMMVPFFFMYLMFLGIIGTGQHMLSSVIEEKNSRVIEVLLSALTPFELMAGKILGLAGIGLTVVGLWAAAAYSAARWKGLSIEVTPELGVYFAIFYIFGFVLFTSVLAGVGSVCNTIKETQSLMMPIMLVFIIPLLGWFKLVQDPNGLLARALSFVPPLTPLVMVLRVSASSDIWIGEILLSIVVLILGVLVTIWAASKVFRTGILMYGKRPTVLEVLRWLRQS